MRAPHLALGLALLLPAAVQAQTPAPELERSKPGRISLRWKAPGPDPVRVARRAVPDGPWMRIIDLPAHTEAFEDRLARGRTSYIYRIDTLGPAPTVGLESPPLAALAEFYVELREVREGVASLYVRKWDPGFGGWLRSDAYHVEVGARIGEQGMMTDFRTQATLVAAGPSTTEPGVHVATVEEQDGTRFLVTTRDALPLEVLTPEERAKLEKQAEEPATPSVVQELTRERPAPKPTPEQPKGTLRFPEPTKVGTAPGTKVIWEIVNQSPDRILVSINGEQGKKRLFKVGAGKTHTVTFKSGGDVEVTAEHPDGDVLPLFAKFGLDSGATYHTEIGIRPVQPGQDKD